MLIEKIFLRNERNELKFMDYIWDVFYVLIVKSNDWNRDGQMLPTAEGGDWTFTYLQGGFDPTKRWRQSSTNATKLLSNPNYEVFSSFKKSNFGFNFNFNFRLGVKVKFEILTLKLKLKLNSKSGKMSVKIVPLLYIVRSNLASIVIYRMLQFIFKAIEILLFFGSVEPVYWFLLLYGLEAK